MTFFSSRKDPDGHIFDLQAKNRGQTASSTAEARSFRQRCRVAAVTAVSSVLLAQPLMAHAYDPLDFAPEHLASARLHGSSIVRRYGKPLYIVKLFAAPGNLKNMKQGDLTSEPFMLDVEYLTPRSGADIAREVRSEMGDMGLADKHRIDDWTASLRRMLPDLKQHDHLSAVYQPEQGTEFFNNGVALDTVPGKEFAAAYFGIWLDDASTVPGARAQLLKPAKPMEKSTPTPTPAASTTGPRP